MNEQNEQEPDRHYCLCGKPMRTRFGICRECARREAMDWAAVAPEAELGE